MIIKLLDTVQLFDLYTFNWCLRRKHRQLMIAVSRWISCSADGYLYAVIVLFAYLLGYVHLFTVLLVGFVIERMTYFVLKNYLKRHRPQDAIPSFTSEIEPLDKFSFPSGHTCAAFFMWGVFTTLFPVCSVPLLLWGILVGVSRVILGVHFPTDIVAGAILGYGLSALVLFVV